MEVRGSVVSGQFYPGDAKSCKIQIEECLSYAKKLENLGRIVAGIVPHAGWTFSGPTAAKVFAQIDRENPPSVFILFGAVHRWGVSEPSIYSSGAWDTPLGELLIDEDIAKKIIEASGGQIKDNFKAHYNEHSIEVQLPFIAYLFPKAKIVPIAIPPGENSAEIGRVVGEFLKNNKINSVVIGTTDLTHYGPGYGFSPKGVGEEALRWTKEVNDARIINLALEMKSKEIVNEANRNHNACGAGAMAATVASAERLGVKEGILLEYTTSYDIMPMRRASDFVGYAGIVYPQAS